MLLISIKMETNISDVDAPFCFASYYKDKIYSFNALRRKHMCE